MLIKKLQRALRDYKNKKKFEIIQKFTFEYRTYFIVRPKNGYVISSNSYIIPEYPKKLSTYEKCKLKNYIMLANILRGRHYTILL